MTNSELKTKWKQELSDRDEVVMRRANDWLRGPVGIEETVSITRTDLGMLFWFVGRLIERLPDDSAEKQP